MTNVDEMLPCSKKVHIRFDILINPTEVILSIMYLSLLNMSAYETCWCKVVLFISLTNEAILEMYESYCFVQDVTCVLILTGVIKVICTVKRVLMHIIGLYHLNLICKGSVVKNHIH